MANKLFGKNDDSIFSTAAALTEKYAEFMFFCSQQADDETPAASGIYDDEDDVFEETDYD